MADAMSDFAEMDKAPAAPQPKQEKARKSPDKPAETPPEKAEETPVEAPAKPAETPTEKQPEVRPVKAAELRTAYEGLKKRVKEEFEPELQRLRAKVQEVEGKTGEETKPLVEKMTALEKRNAELEKHIAFVDYTKSADFAKNHAEPYRRAWDEAIAEFRELTVSDAETGETRPANENDLLHLANLKLSDMDAQINAMFGHSAARVISHITNLKQLSAKQQRAIEQAKQNSDEWRKNQALEQQTRMAETSRNWEAINKGLEERFPKAYKPDEADADDVASHAKGFALANLMFLGAKGLDQKQIDALPSGFRETIKAGKDLNDMQRIQLHAIARLKIANHDRKVAALKKATTRIAELEKALAEYEKSEPRSTTSGKAAPAGASGKDWLETAQDEIQALDK